MFILGSLSLLVTAWVVSDTVPGAERSWWAAGFFVFGLIYGGLMQALLNAGEGEQNLREFLRATLALNLAPFAVVAALAAWGVWGTAYHVYAWWIGGTFAACVLLTLGGVVYRLLNSGTEARK